MFFFNIWETFWLALNSIFLNVTRTYVIIQGNVGISHYCFLVSWIINGSFIEPKCETISHVVGNFGPRHISVSATICDIDTINKIINNFTMRDIYVSGTPVDIETRYVIVFGYGCSKNWEKYVIKLFLQKQIEIYVLFIRVTFKIKV